jgi:hypothetical protein
METKMHPKQEVSSRASRAQTRGPKRRWLLQGDRIHKDSSLMWINLEGGPILDPVESSHQVCHRLLALQHTSGASASSYEDGNPSTRRWSLLQGQFPRSTLNLVCLVHHYQCQELHLAPFTSGINSSSKPTSSIIHLATFLANNATRESCELIFLKCHGYGHKSRECPSNQGMVIIEDGDMSPWVMESSKP